MSEMKEYFDSLKGLSVAVIGMGVSNTPLIRMLLREGLKVTVCDRSPREKLAEQAAELESLGAKFIETKDKDVLSLDEYTVEAYKGNHTISVCHFIIKDKEKCLFYALDGAWLQYEEIRAVWKNKPDLAVFDATVGFVEKDWRVFEHNNLNMVIEMKKSIDRDIKKYVISHMAYTLHTDHDTLSAEMEKHGIVTAYDGLELEF